MREEEEELQEIGHVSDSRGVVGLFARLLEAYAGHKCWLCQIVQVSNAVRRTVATASATATTDTAAGEAVHVLAVEEAVRGAGGALG